MGTATKKEEAQTEPRTKTQYMVLFQINEAWEPLGTYPGLNDLDAIRGAAAGAGIEEGTLVAVPARSFRQRTIKVQTRRSVSFT